MNKEQEDLIVKYFRHASWQTKPEVQGKWEKDLRDSFTFGCDWLSYFGKIWNPLHAAGVELMVAKLAALEARFTRLDGARNVAPESRAPRERTETTYDIADQPEGSLLDLNPYEG